MRRLIAQIYLAIVAVLVLFALLVAVGWRVLHDEGEKARELDALGALFAEVLPAPDAPREMLAGKLQRLHERVGVDVMVLDRSGEPLASAGAAVSVPPSGRLRHGWSRPDRGGWRFALRLPDGRWLLGRGPHRSRGLWLWVLPVLAVAIAVVAWPLARRISGRLERLKARVEALGEGDLGARVEIEGRDEVARLARSFNRAAERIEHLVTTKRHVLASASHELRSPLARIRIALELIEREPRPDLISGARGDIAELEDLIEELLLSSQLESLGRARHAEPVDLLALAAEEAARVDAEVSGIPCEVEGSTRMLRRMLRNLLENGRRHARSTVEIEVYPGVRGEVVVRVADDGPGVPEAERERIFEPFYRPAGLSEGQGGGVGLGLALVRQIAAGLGGSASLAAGAGDAGGGACFEVRLPALASGGGACNG